MADVLPSHDLLLYVVHSVVGVEPDHDTRPVTQPYLHMTGRGNDVLLCILYRAGRLSQDFVMFFHVSCEGLPGQ